MQTKFYNFWNPQTYHFFVWVTESGMIDPEALVLKAFTEVESSDLIELDTSFALRETLANELLAVLSDLTGHAGVPVSDLHEIGAVDDSTDSFFSPIIQFALA